MMLLVNYIWFLFHSFQQFFQLKDFLHLLKFRVINHEFSSNLLRETEWGDNRLKPENNNKKRTLVYISMCFDTFFFLAIFLYFIKCRIHLKMG
jgi:hypothetical protein